MTNKIINIKNLNREEKLGSHVLSRLSAIRSLCADGMGLDNLINFEDNILHVTTTMWAMCPLALKTTGMPEKEAKDLYGKLKHQLNKEIELFIEFLEKSEAAINEIIKEEKNKGTH